MSYDTNIYPNVRTTPGRATKAGTVNRMAHSLENLYEKSKKKYASLKVTGTKSLSAGVITAISWDAFNFGYPASGWYAGGNPTRLTIPSTANAKIVQVSAQLYLNTLLDTDLDLYIYKNGSSAWFGSNSQTTAHSFGTGTATNKVQGFSVGTNFIYATSGDYFELYAASSAAATVANSENSWLALEVLEGL